MLCKRKFVILGEWNAKHNTPCAELIGFVRPCVLALNTPGIAYASQKRGKSVSDGFSRASLCVLAVKLHWQFRGAAAYWNWHHFHIFPLFPALCARAQEVPFSRVFTAHTKQKGTSLQKCLLFSRLKLNLTQPCGGAPNLPHRAPRGPTQSVRERRRCL